MNRRSWWYMGAMTFWTLGMYSRALIAQGFHFEIGLVYFGGVVMLSVIYLAKMLTKGENNEAKKTQQSGQKS